VSNIVPIRPGVKRTRRCIGCGIRLAPDAPAHHYACRACFTHSQFRRAVERFRRRP